MRNFLRFYCRLSVGASLMLTALACSANPFERIGWLAGCWGAENREAGSGEHWMAPAGGSMLGVGRTVKGGKTVETEFLQIRADDQGKLQYIALPSGQTQATFGEKSFANNEIVFENLQHDFPQRISYRLSAEHQVLARIEGMRNGKLKGIEYPLKRVACANEAARP
ncbi:MAG: hypothetical protein RL748_486 [Pseudomonadota bacterium]|jgi:hypothetical protein